jgi:hypothetical protein
MSDEKVDAIKVGMELEKENEESLTKVEPSKLGKMLLRLATKDYEEDLREQVVHEVKRMMACRDESRRQLDKYQKSVDWYTRRLEAIDKGEFELNDLTGALEFADKDLQRANY